MDLGSRTVRADVRRAYRCDCAGAVEKRPGLHLTKRLDAVRSELDAVNVTMGIKPPSCPWRAFSDREAGEILRAHDWYAKKQLRDWVGDDPPWRLLEGVHHYAGALAIARADAAKLRRAHRDNKPAPPPRRPGHVIQGVTRG